MCQHNQLKHDWEVPEKENALVYIYLYINNMSKGEWREIKTRKQCCRIYVQRLRHICLHAINRVALFCVIGKPHTSFNCILTYVCDRATVSPLICFHFVPKIYACQCTRIFKFKAILASQLSRLFGIKCWFCCFDSNPGCHMISKQVGLILWSSRLGTYQIVRSRWQKQPTDGRPQYFNATPTQSKR